MLLCYNGLPKPREIPSPLKDLPPGACHSLSQIPPFIILGTFDSDLDYPSNNLVFPLLNLLSFSNLILYPSQSTHCHGCT